VVLSRSASSSSSSWPSLSEVFSPLHDEEDVSLGSCRSLDGFGEQFIPAPDFSSGSFDMSEHMNGLTSAPGPGHSGNAEDNSQNDNDRSFNPPLQSVHPHMTFVPLLPGDKSQGKQTASIESKRLFCQPTLVNQRTVHRAYQIHSMIEASHSASAKQFFSCQRTMARTTPMPCWVDMDHPLSSILPPSGPPLMSFPIWSEQLP
jgi:hypothetical protein